MHVAGEAIQINLIARGMPSSIPSDFVIQQLCGQSEILRKESRGGAIHVRAFRIVSNLGNIALGDGADLRDGELQFGGDIPQRLVEEAVRGMLPKTKMGEAMYRKLKVYAGPDHPHAAQKPIKLEVA